LAVTLLVACSSLRANLFLGAPPALRKRSHGSSLGKSTISVSRDAIVAADTHHAVQGVNICASGL
jgi:hypothetical protein